MITFDQPLYWKAMEMVKKAKESDIIAKIVVVLGGFHTIMNVLGLIGQVMDGSGIKETIVLIYTEDTAPHILSGKAVSRAIRAHFILDDALHVLLFKDVFGIDGNNDSVMTLNFQEQFQLKEEIEHLLKEPIPIEEIKEYQNVNKIKPLLNSKLTTLMALRTAKMWIQLMEMVGPLKKFIRAERTGNWKLHLETLSQMLPLFSGYWTQQLH